MKLILICDLNIKKQGHYIGYNQYILNNFDKIEISDPTLKFIFLYNQEAKDLLKFPEQATERVSFLSYKNTDDNFQNRIKVFGEIKKFIADNRVNHMIFMDLDKYQLAIALTNIACTISGILFRPHHRITQSNGSFSAKTKTRIKKFKKIAAEKLLLSNKRVSRIFILNDTEGVSFLNEKFNTKVFHFLTDPVFSYKTFEDKSTEDKENKTFNYLIFGAINERKNITNIIKAYDLADFPVKTKLLIVGPGESSYLNYLDDLTRSLKTVTGETKSIEIKNEFVSNEDMDAYFANSDACLLIYKNFFGSSGLLGRAALHKTKVIGPNVGLLTEMITENKMGICCDPENCEGISKALSEIRNFNVPAEFFDNFYKQNSPEKFIKTLLTA